MKKLWKNIGIKVSIITIIINFLLFVFKLIAGLVANSNAMISDSFHSFSDVLTTIIVIFGLIISSKEADKKHPYGHERIESLFAIILAFMLFLTGVYVGYLGLHAILNRNDIPLPIPGILALMAAIISILVKEIMYRYTIKIAKKINSSSMIADAWHHRSDALSSIGSMLGIIGSRLGFPLLDPLCSILLCLLIIKTSSEIFLTAIKELLDTSCDEETYNNLLNIIKENNNEFDLINLKTRLFGNKIYVDADISVDGNLSVIDANKIVLNIHDSVEEQLPVVKHCNIHILPNK